MRLLEKCPISFRIFVVTLSTIFGLWLAGLWIDSCFQPNHHSHQSLIGKMDYSKPEDWKMRCGITLESRRRKRGTEFVVLAMRQYVDKGGGTKTPKLFSFDTPVLTVSLSPIAIACGPTTTVTTYIMFTAAPAWIVTVGAWSCPLVCLIRGPLRRLRRRRRGLCINCGYNLTGAPEPRCPECGTKTIAKIDSSAPGGAKVGGHE